MMNTKTRQSFAGDGIATLPPYLGLNEVQQLLVHEKLDAVLALPRSPRNARCSHDWY